MYIKEEGEPGVRLASRFMLFFLFFSLLAAAVPVLRLRPLWTVPNPPLPIIFPICCCLTNKIVITLII